LLFFLKHPPTALCHVMCPATTREKSSHVFTNYHIFYETHVKHNLTSVLCGLCFTWESWIAINLFVTLQSFFDNDIQYKCKRQNFVGLCENLNTLISRLKAIPIHGACVIQTNKTGMSQKYFESSVARRLSQKLKHSLSYLYMLYV
jgi:hypothetical protein